MRGVPRVMALIHFASRLYLSILSSDYSIYSN